ncbi:BQ5605_C027g10367 [Microbotryum silenes-dioicae]|uniref:BQ5605_C027g10367 protein n=1 Tax=Microbotryum silenes-dioicae TaxID=796604 RepID=A0A2X0MR09_9BASI|nr:BQ5605_C027g10367 [Microbotryum silenes-dioicae]
MAGFGHSGMLGSNLPRLKITVTTQRRSVTQPLGGTTTSLTVSHAWAKCAETRRHPLQKRSSDRSTMCSDNTPTLLALFEVKIRRARLDGSWGALARTFETAATPDLLHHCAYLIESEVGVAGTTTIDPYSLELVSEIGRTDRSESDALVQYVYRGATLVSTIAIEFKRKKKCTTN